jgi:hypothetical protein
MDQSPTANRFFVIQANLSGMEVASFVSFLSTCKSRINPEESTHTVKMCSVVTPYVRKRSSTRYGAAVDTPPSEIYYYARKIMRELDN